MLATFQSQLLMLGNLADTSRDNLFLKFHYPLSLDGTREYILMTSKEETRILRFASNPKVGVGLIMRESLEGSVINKVEPRLQGFQLKEIFFKNIIQ